MPSKILTALPADAYPVIVLRLDPLDLERIGRKAILYRKPVVLEINPQARTLTIRNDKQGRAPALSIAIKRLTKAWRRPGDTKAVLKQLDAMLRPVGFAVEITNKGKE